MKPMMKIPSRRYPNIMLKVIPGHFVTPNSHINNYIDLTTMKTRQSEAVEVAKAISETYASSTIVDTIVCMDGMEVIGAFLADRLTRAGIMSMNQHKTIYIVRPEFDVSGQMIFRENNQMMIRGKHCLLLLASATTGRTVARASNSIYYYGGTITGITAIFSAVSKMAGQPINALFTSADLPEYRTYTPDNCSMCRNRQKIDAICNGYGYSTVN